MSKTENNQPFNRRDFLKMGGIIGAGSAVAYSLPVIQTAFSSQKAHDPSKPLWKMIIDTNKCQPGCDDCTVACRTENNVNEDIHWIRKAKITREFPNGKKVTVNAPILCNQCDNPPCALVCPVEATFQRPDGVVDVDKHRCIGCRYCVIGCPYNVRVFNYVESKKDMSDESINPLYPKRMHGVAESCNFCSHIIDEAVAHKKEPVPACVKACKAGAIVFGDTNDPNSNISKYIDELSEKKVLATGLREDLGTKPKVLYIGL